MRKIDDTTKTALDKLLKEDDNAIPDSELVFVTGGAVKTKTPVRKTKKKKTPVSTINDTQQTVLGEPPVLDPNDNATPDSGLGL